MASDEGPSPFDRFADLVSRFTSKAWFFAACVLVVVIWAPSYWLVGDLNTWQLIINSTTTIVTFLLVALLQNTQCRADAASQQKLNAIAEYLTSNGGKKATAELRQVIGLEERESSRG